MSKLTRSLAIAVVPLLTLALVQPSFAAAAARKHRTTKVSNSHTSRSKRTSAKKKPLGPRGIDDARATQIQTALIKAGYLTGEPSGHWDGASQAAMEKLQADNGWQTKLVPDSRALIKLGLGPNPTPAADVSQSATTSTAANSAPSARP